MEETALGKGGFLGALKAGALWVDSSTVNPSFTRLMAEVTEQRGVHFLDAPVAGSRVPAEKGLLTFFVGGDPQDLETCRSLLNMMGQKVVHVGGHGMGSAMKMVNNLVMGVSLLAFSEGLVLGESLGISRSAIFDALTGSIVVAPAATGKREKIESGNYSPDFPLQWMHKDLVLAAISAYEQGVAMPTTNAAKEVFALAKQAGMAEEDLSAVYKFLKGS